METVLKVKWLAPEKHTFGIQHANSRRTLKLEVMISGFSMLEKIENQGSRYEQYHLNLRKCCVWEDTVRYDILLEEKIKPTSNISLLRVPTLVGTRCELGVGCLKHNGPKFVRKCFWI